ncbi:hydrolase [Shewanella intestini]|uniref:Hydrolase n=1 Tax=Shewanella intestini TaxID=2017544 RepID=A0ABS5I1Y8_9GAMM|nr:MULTISPECIES: hydrolase [Shewanella]MBR9727709.1 hydrolase [Shewanella intestini]MRG35141.1 hydrolase [Shewanella sp. XMDDZSB0408]
MKKRFSPPWWAKNPHIQTILPVLRKVPQPQTVRRRQELEDGDFIDLDWLGEPINGQPILVLVHGLEGSVASHYARRMLTHAQQLGLTAVVHHHRSCSGEPNRLLRSYHSGDTEDIAFTLKQLAQAYPQSPLYAVGYSLGGNVLAKYQGTYQQDSLLAAAVVISAPLALGACAKRLEGGFSTIYQHYLIKQLQQKMRTKLNTPELASQMPITHQQLNSLSTFYLFDDQITAPLHGFADVQDYYQRASGLQYLQQISVPTLIIHAQDDPFMTDEVIPQPHQLSSAVEYELHQRGGHVGFICGGSPWRPKFYIEQRALSFLLTKDPQ